MAIVQGTDDFKPPYKATAPEPTPPNWWPPIDPDTGLADNSYPYIKPPTDLLLSCEAIPQARPFDASKDGLYRRVPLPGTSTSYEPPTTDKADPLGLDGTIFNIKASDGKTYVCIFYRQWFYVEEGTAVPSLISGTFVLKKFGESAPSNQMATVWPPISGASIDAIQSTSFRVKGPSVDQYYRVGLINPTGTSSVQDVSNIGRIWFSLFKISGTPLPSSSTSTPKSSSSSSAPKPLSSSSSTPKPSSSSSSSSAKATKLSGFINAPTTYIKGVSGDINFFAGDDFPVGGDVIFQTWSDVSQRVEAAIVGKPPTSYPASALNSVSDGNNAVQALIRNAAFSVVRTISIPVVFVKQPSSSSSSSKLSSSSSSSSSRSVPSSSSSSSASNTQLNLLQAVPMFIESQQLVRDVETAQGQLQQLVAQINAAKTANDVVAALKALPQLTSVLTTQLTQVRNEANSLSSDLGSLVPQSQGLFGMYYANTTLTGTPKVRIDPSINFSWANGIQPIADVPATFSTRWTGKIKAKVGGSVKFTATSDDGVRVTINGQKIIDNWTSHPAMDFVGSITLTAGVNYDIVIDYFNGGGPGSLVLAWEGTGLAKEIVPTTHLTTK